MAVFDDNVLLSSCIFEDNTSDNNGGAIYVDSYYDINVKGKMIIKDNTSNDTRHNNLCLQEGIASTARLYSGGLYEGSYIGVSTTDDSTDFARNIAEYQKKYFHAESGKITSDVVDTVDTPVITASVFGKGSVIVIVSVVLAGLVTALAAIAVKKKGGKENENDSDDE